jgi:hypothetical protein
VFSVGVFQVCEELACDIHVFPLSVRLLDLFLAKIKTPRCNLQLLGATCLHVASKLRNTQLISTETMVYYTDNSIVAAEMNVSSTFTYSMKKSLLLYAKFPIFKVDTQKFGLFSNSYYLWLFANTCK